MRVLLLACAPCALLTTAALAEDAPGFFALGLTGGIAAINLPDSADVLISGDATATGGLDNIALGYTLGLSGAVGIGEVGGYDAFVGFNAFGTLASGSGSTTRELSGRGLLVVQGLSTPITSALIDIETTRGGGASDVNLVVDNPTNGQGGGGGVSSLDLDIVLGGGSASAVSIPTGDGFVWGAANATVAPDTALGVGAIANSGGGMFIAVGDLDGIVIEQSSSFDIAYAGADITFGVNQPLDDSSALQAYAGPSYRYLGQRGESSVLIDIPEVVGSTVEHPIYGMEREADIDSHYLGAVIGGVYSASVSEKGAISVGVEGSLYYASHSFSGRDVYSLTGGNGVAGWAGPDEIVNGPEVGEDVGGIAVAARVQAGYTHQLTDNMQFTLAASADYLSSAAQAGPASDVAYAADADENDAQWSSASSGSNTVMSFGSMWAFTLTASVTGQF